MAITDKEEGVWNLDEVYNKQNQGSIWEYTGAAGLYMAGNAQYGRLGLNGPGPSQTFPATLYSSPVQVGTDTNWFEGAFGDGNHVSAMAQKTDGSVWSWGDSGTKGASGWNVPSADSYNRSSPVQVISGPGATGSLVSSGTANVMYRNSKGELWSWGQGNRGQLGLNDRTDRSSPTQVGSDTDWSNNIWSGGYCAMAVKTDGSLWTWGRNAPSDAQGCLGHNNKTDYSSPTQVPGSWATEKGQGCAGTAVMACIKGDGSLWTWGRNRDGVLGHNNETDRSSPRQVPGSYSRVTIGTGGQCGAIKTDGTLWAWGANTYGNLGQNNRTKYSSPRQVGTDTDWEKIFGQGPYVAQAFAAIKTDKTMYTWGNSAVAGIPNGILGHNDTVRYSSPVQVPGTWQHASIGQYLAGYISDL